MMKTTVFLLSLLAISAAEADEYALKIVRPASSKNLHQSCQKQGIISVVFQTFEGKSGPTYVRFPVSNALANYFGSSMVKLDADPNLPSCAEEAARTVSELSNLKIKMTAELSKFKLSVSFDEGSLHPDLYNYKLQFDGQTADVNNGSEIQAELSTCADLQFTLTPYIQGKESGNSVAYQLPMTGVPPPEVNIQAIIYTSAFRNVTINWKNFLKTDPCLTVRGYEVELSSSFRGDANKTLQFSATETSVVLSCEETSDYASLKFSVITDAGVQIPESFVVNPGATGSRLKKYFDKMLQACVFMDLGATAGSRESFCTSNGGQPFDRVKILQGVEKTPYRTYLPLTYNNSASTWQWEDGTVMSSTDPLWEAGSGGPPVSGRTSPNFYFKTGKISLMNSSGGANSCFI